MTDWVEDNIEKRANFPMDYSFKRTLFKLGRFSFMERLRVVHYPEEPKPHIVYNRIVGLSYMVKPYLNKWSPRYILLTQRVLNFFYEKNTYDYNIRDTKWIKLPFIEALFIDVVRDRKLESLGI